MSRNARRANSKVKDEAPNWLCRSGPCADCLPNTDAAQMQGSFAYVIESASRKRMREGRAREIKMNQRGYDERKYPRYLWRGLEVLGHIVHSFVLYLGKGLFNSPDVQQARDGIETRKERSNQGAMILTEDGLNSLRRPNPS